MRAQNIKTDSYHSNLNVLNREDSLFLKASRKSNSESNLTKVCTCAKIMCCDDDLFQHSVLQKLLLPDEECKNRFSSKNNVDISQSGEDLILKYIIQREMCHCNGPQLIITDFNMGEDKMNGLQVISKLRQLGYSGPAVIRTSNNFGSLTEISLEDDMTLENKAINIYMSKNNLKRQKEVFKKFFGESSNFSF